MHAYIETNPNLSHYRKSQQSKSPFKLKRVPENYTSFPDMELSSQLLLNSSLEIVISTLFIPVLFHVENYVQ